MASTSGHTARTKTPQRCACIPATATAQRVRRSILRDSNPRRLGSVRVVAIHGVPGSRRRGRALLRCVESGGLRLLHSPAHGCGLGLPAAAHEQALPPQLVTTRDPDPRLPSPPGRTHGLATPRALPAISDATVSPCPAMISVVIQLRQPLHPAPPEAHPHITLAATLSGHFTPGGLPEVPFRPAGPLPSAAPAFHYRFYFDRSARSPGMVTTARSAHQLGRRTPRPGRGCPSWMMNFITVM